MQFECRKFEPARLNFRCESSLKSSCFLLRNLVLDRDVKSRFVEVLIGQRAVKMLGNQRTQRQHTFALQSDRGALPQVEQAIDTRIDWREFAGNLWQQSLELIEQRRRKGVEQGDMRMQVVALGRKVFAPQSVGP